jgi:hypothetical protein
VGRTRVRDGRATGLGGAVAFQGRCGTTAGTEINVELGGGDIPGPASATSASSRLHTAPGTGRAKVKGDLRRFKQHVETGEIPRSDGSPEGERAERKLKQRPAQPLEESELEKAGVR